MTMSTAGMRGCRSFCVVFFFVVVVLVWGGGRVSGRPQPSHGKGVKGQESPLRFSPELLLEPSLESAVSPINVLPHPPMSRPASRTDKNDDASHIGSGAVGSADLPDFSLDLDGPEEKWEQDPDVSDSDIPPQKVRLQSAPQFPKDPVHVPSVVENDVDVEWPQGNLRGFHGGDAGKDLGVSELKLGGAAPGPLPSTSSGSANIPLPHKSAERDIPRQQLVEDDVDVDGPEVPDPDDVSTFLDLIIPWREMLEEDTEEDGHVHGDALPPTPKTYNMEKSILHWKELALADLEDLTDTDIDVATESSPFDDDDEEENEVPEELVRQVVEAMDAPASWRQSAKSKHRKAGPIWEQNRHGDGKKDDDRGRGSYSPQESRLLTLIVESIDDPRKKPEDRYVEELSVWQILTNFPFPMLLRHSDHVPDNIDDNYDDDFYDDDSDDDYDEDDYEEEDDDDDDDEYDYEDYEDDYDDEEDEVNADRQEYFEDDSVTGESDRLELDDYFDDVEYDDCEDCSEDVAERQELTILSFPPMLT